MAKLNEKELITQARQDPQAFAQLYEIHIDRIYAYVFRRTGERELSEDITASTFESALKNMSKFRWQETGFAAWLYRIARNKIIQHYRRQRLIAPFTPHSNNHAHAVPGLHFTEEIENKDQLAEAFSQISSKDREVLTLRFFEDLSSAEVGIILKCSKENVYLRLHRALSRVRKHMQEMDSLENETIGEKTNG